MLPEVPQTVRRCQGDPEPPTGSTQREAAAYTVRLWAAWSDCHGNLGAVNDILTDAEARVAR